MENLLKYVLYINLDHREDRREYVLNELKKIGLVEPERFSAIKMPAGNVGCTLSHIRCLELAKSREWPHVFICEDDITFTNPSVFLDSLKNFVDSNLVWDVLIIGGNNAPPFTIINSFCVRVQNTQTTTGYIGKKEYYDRLIANYKEGLANLMRESEKKKMFAIDVWWKQLQQRDRWYLLTPLTVNQKYDYSDIEERVTDYRNMMLDLDKRELIERLLKEEENKRRFSMKM